MNRTLISLDSEKVSITYKRFWGTKTVVGYVEVIANIAYIRKVKDSFTFIVAFSLIEENSYSKIIEINKL